MTPGASAGKRLPQSAFLEPDPVVAARYFLGKTLFVRDLRPSTFPGETTGAVTGGIIVETEAYGGAEDKACHGYGNRRTARTEIMFGPGGPAYVYLCYGIHWMINIVTGPVGSPMAVLVRAVRITHGADLVRQRRPGIAEKHWASGPGKVTSALAITREHNGLDMVSGHDIWLEDFGYVVEDKDVFIGPRIGVDYAGEWALKPWRFVWQRPPQAGSL